MSEVQRPCEMIWVKHFEIKLDDLIVGYRWPDGFMHSSFSGPKRRVEKIQVCLERDLSFFQSVSGTFYLTDKANVEWYVQREVSEASSSEVLEQQRPELKGYYLESDYPLKTLEEPKVYGSNFKSLQLANVVADYPTTFKREKYFVTNQMREDWSRALRAKIQESEAKRKRETMILVDPYFEDWE
jgi:hypothetical protein